jgi:hypothetical protein
MYIWKCHNKTHHVTIKFFLKERRKEVLGLDYFTVNSTERLNNYSQILLSNWRGNDT